VATAQEEILYSLEVLDEVQAKSTPNQWSIKAPFLYVIMIWLLNCTSSLSIIATNIA
jgi:hypothetical protein